MPATVANTYYPQKVGIEFDYPLARSTGAAAIFERVKRGKADYHFIETTAWRM